MRAFPGQTPFEKSVLVYTRGPVQQMVASRVASPKTKCIPKPIPGATEEFRKKSNFEKSLGAMKQPTQQQFWGFWRAHGSGYMGLVATTWVPMGAQVPVLSPNDQPNASQGRKKGYEKNLKVEKISGAAGRGPVPPGAGAFQGDRWERPVEDLGVHHMAWPADTQSRQGRHHAPPQAACEP